MSVISPTAPIDHLRRRRQIIEQCATWLKGNGLSESRAEYLANFIERHCERWATDRRRPSV